ncbi:hypothetical protein IHE33_04590 [Mycetohabitans endofungorum]|uniref:hypothetical protein n=1 Tax=Mycetohabitans endofungorum TaxID=417203 RepID=UPI0030D4AAB4
MQPKREAEQQRAGTRRECRHAALQVVQRGVEPPRGAVRHEREHERAATLERAGKRHRGKGKVEERYRQCKLIDCVRTPAPLQREHGGQAQRAEQRQVVPQAGPQLEPCG